MIPTEPGWRRLALACYACLIAVTAGALGWVVCCSSLLAVDRIEVTGTQRATTQQVVTASGVRVDTPLVRVDVGAVRDRVRAVQPVESVRVRRAWPDTLRIRVRERKPVVAVPDSGSYLLLDANGVRVATVGKPPERIPVVHLRGSAPGPTGGNRIALRVLGALPDRLAAKVRTVVIADDGGATLRLRGGATAIWGGPERSAEKARLLSTLQRRRDAATYDVSSSDVVTAR